MYSLPRAYDLPSHRLDQAYSTQHVIPDVKTASKTITEEVS